MRTDIALVQKEPGTELEFPAVTVCNNNKVHCGNLRDLIEKCETQVRPNAEPGLIAVAATVDFTPFIAQ